MKKMVIVGGGIAGLSTGCFSQMHGFESQIIEMHSIPGGVCTSWRRGDYLFDHCLHWVLGSNTGTSLYPIFKELGIADGIKFYYTEKFREVTVNDTTLTVYTDIKKFEAELLRLYPCESAAISKYIRLIWKFTKFNPPMDGDFGNFGIVNFIKLLPFMPLFLKLKSISIETFLNQLFKSPELKEMLFRLFPVKKLPALMAVMPLAFMHKKEGGYPLGGSLNFARAIEKKYLDLGGRVRYNSKVTKVIVENGAVCGVQIDNGEIVKADIVVSACDGRSALFEMHDGKYLNTQITEFYKNPSLWPPIMTISIGVNRDFSDMPEIMDFKLKEPIVVGGIPASWSGVFHYCHDSRFAPKGKSVLQTQIETDYFFWKNLYEKDKNEYNREKQKVLMQYIDILENKFPGIKDEIEVTDVGSPVTWTRYTGNWQGSYQGWVPTVKTFGITLPKKLPGLKNFYMTGQWVFPGGGVPMCMAQARNLVRIIVKDEKKKMLN